MGAAMTTDNNAPTLERAREIRAFYANGRNGFVSFRNDAEIVVLCDAYIAAREQVPVACSDVDAEIDKNPDTGSVIYSWDEDAKMQMSLIFGEDGSIGFATYMHGLRMHGKVTTPPAAPRIEVDDAMVERACRTNYEWVRNDERSEVEESWDDAIADTDQEVIEGIRSMRDIMRAALQAALNPEPT